MKVGRDIFPTIVPTNTWKVSNLLENNQKSKVMALKRHLEQFLSKLEQKVIHYRHLIRELQYLSVKPLLLFAGLKNNIQCYCAKSTVRALKINEISEGGKSQNQWRVKASMELFFKAVFRTHYRFSIKGRTFFTIIAHNQNYIRCRLEKIVDNIALDFFLLLIKP